MIGSLFNNKKTHGVQALACGSKLHPNQENKLKLELHAPFPRRRRRNYRFWSINCCLIFFILLSSIQVDQQDRLLVEGNAVERELSGGQSHSYPLALTTGQYTNLVIDQLGIDVVVQVLGADGEEILEFDSETRLNARESVSLVAEDGVSYSLKVTARQNYAAPGRYQIHVVELRPATDDDRARHEWRKLYSAAYRLFQAGKLSESQPLVERAVEISEKVFGPNKSEVASALHLLATIYLQKSEYGKAEPLYQRAQEIWEKVLGPDHPKVALVQHNLGLIYHRMGLLAKADSSYQRSLSIFVNALGEDHPLVAASLGNSASLYQDKGDYDKVESFFQRSLKIVEKIQGPEHPNVAVPLLGLASVYKQRGDYDKAELHYQRALDVSEKSLGPEHNNVARILNGLAELHYDRGDYLKAEPLYYRAMDIWKKARGPEHPVIADVLTNLASVYCEKGDYERAETFILRALGIYEKVLGREHFKVAGSLKSLADLHHLRGNYAKAEPLYQRALEIQEKMFGPWNPEVAKSLYSLAMYYASKAEIGRTFMFLSRANAIAEHNIALNLALGSERQKLAFLALFSVETDFTLSFQSQVAPKNRLALDLALTTLLRRKGRGLDAMADTIAALRLHASSQEQVIFTQLSEARSQLAALTLREADAPKPETYRTQLKPLEEKVEQLETELSARSERFRAQTKPVTIAAVQKALPAGSALVEFARYTPRELQSAKSKPPRYLAYVLGAKDQPKWVDLGEASAIERKIDAWRKALRNPNRMDVRKLGRDVDEKVMRPVRSLLGETRRLLIAPDGALNLIPFAALVDEENKYQIERFVISYLTSGRDLLRLQSPLPSRTAPLVIANPDFGRLLSLARQTNQKSGDPGERQNNQSPIFFQTLPSTRDEALAIKAVLADASLLMREQATEAALKQVRAPRILHIATHGFFLEDQEAPLSKTRGIPADQPPRINDLRLSQWAAHIENPLLRSGIALAGANQGKSGEDDGLLTALEAGSLDLWGTKLVALSACDTGIGVVKNGEGVQGLRRALILAGSESQVMSLWPVLDSAAKDLMIPYYKALQQGEGRSDGLRESQLRMLRSKNRQHPFYWAAFIQSGEWANLDGRR